jgi:hypothetical protein
MKRFTKAVAQRNVNFLKAIEFIAESGTVTIMDLTTHFGFNSSSTARKMIRELTEMELIELSHKGDPSGRSKYGTTHHRLCEGTSERAANMFPVRPEDVTAFDALFDQRQHESYKQPAAPTVVNVHRDPMDILLMGTGRAPSLNFKDSLGG